MKLKSKSWENFWNKSVQKKGHTGYTDQLIHQYDQPLRIKTISKIIKKLFNNNLMGKAVLDIGCGTGDFIEEIVKLRAKKVTGIDISSAVLNKAHDRFKSDSKVELRHGSVVEMLKDKEAFDLILSVTVLQHHLDDNELKSVLKLMHKALKPKGYMIIFELAPSNLEKEHNSKRYMDYLVERSPTLWRETFHKAGFKIISEPNFPQLGKTLIRYQELLIDFLRAQKPKSKITVDKTSILTDSKIGRKKISQFTSRALARKVLNFFRKFILFICYPADHRLGLPLPPQSLREYRIFVIKRDL